MAEDYLPQIQRQLGLGNHMTVQAFDRAQRSLLATGTGWPWTTRFTAERALFRIRAIFTNADLALFPNQFVNAKLLIDTLRDQTLIPASVIQRNGTNTFVYVVSAQGTVQTNTANVGMASTNSPATNMVFTVEMRTVKVGATDGDTTRWKGWTRASCCAAQLHRLEDKAKVTKRKHRGRAPCRRHEEVEPGMSPSRQFILRPVARRC